MNMCSRCNKPVSFAANATSGGMNHEPCECDVQSVERVGEILSKSLRIQIPQDSTEALLNVADEAENAGLATHASSSSPGSTSHSDEWSDEGCKEEALAPNTAASFNTGDAVQQASYLSLHSPSTLISAMKGSREKQGIACLKLSVSWSPDVYDPVPTTVSHTVKSKQKRQYKSEKKSGKGKHKGSKSSKQSTGKDKKQTRKSSGSTKNCYTTMDAHDRMLGFDNQSVNFDVGSTEFCAGSFLNASLIKVQMPATEAL
uniref:Uncharacterized protein n=1 Tax=Kalanchoe fedtschenkoi TaxID=63787 RepID=A0A7N0VE43_KALFE